MDSLQGIKKRIGAVENVGQITKAMEVVAATKMRKSQEVAFASRPYAFRVMELLERVLKNAPLRMVLTMERKVKRTLVVIVASDKGLTGSFNAQVLRASDQFFSAMITERKRALNEFVVVPVGKKAAHYADKKGLEMARIFSGMGDTATPEEARPLAEFLVQGFLNASWDDVVVISTHFRTTLKQEVLKRRILPLDIASVQQSIREIVPEYGRHAESGNVQEEIFSSRAIEYIYEPSAKTVLRTLLPHLLTMQVYHFILEANASEHSARMVAMKTASDNAKELSNDLTLLYNKARQAAITKELVEITSTQNALT